MSSTMEKILENEMKKLTSEERGTLRENVLLTFDVLYKNINNRMNKFENTILDTIIQRNKDLSIVNMIIPKEDFYLYEENFSPVVPSDKDILPLFSILQEEEKVYEKIVYVGEMSDIDRYDGYEFESQLNINGVNFIFKLKLEKDTAYDDKIYELYKTFQLNFLKWKTINAPYLKRIFRIIITDYDENVLKEIRKVPDASNINKLDIKDSIINDFFAESYITIWNITNEKKYGNGIIEPTENRINYIHNINSDEDIDLYLVPEIGTHIYSVGKTSKGYRIVIDTNKEMTWRFINISDVAHIRYGEKLKYPVFNNYEISLFTNKLKKLNKVRIRTIAEVHRIMNSFENIKKRFDLIKLEIGIEERDVSENKDLDYFIIDEFKLKKDTKYMYLYLKIIEKDVFINEELSFLVTIIQSFFPEYQCKGVINE